MRRALPLVPAWLVGAWLLAFGERTWDPESLGANLHGDSMAAGWIILIALAAGTALYVGAPFFGRQLAVSNRSSMLVGLGDANATQRAFGAGVVRIGALGGLYVLLGCLAFALA